MNLIRNSIRGLVAILALMLAILPSCNGCDHGEHETWNGKDTITVDSDTVEPFVPLNKSVLIPPDEAKTIISGYREQWKDVPFTEYLLDFQAIDNLLKTVEEANGVRVYHAQRGQEYVTVIWPLDSLSGNDITAPAAVYVGGSGNICPPNCDLASCTDCNSRGLTPYVRESDYSAAIGWIKAYAPTFEDPAAHGFVPDMKALARMRQTPRCTSVRVYQAMDAGARCVVMTAAGKDGKGLFDAAATFKESISQLCPKNCDLQKISLENADESQTR